MRSVPWITLYVGVLIVLGYCLGTAVRWKLWSTASLRPAAAVDPDRGWIAADHGRVDPAIVIGAVEAITALGWSLFVLWFTDRLAPGTTTFRDSSTIGFLASQALTAWESASLWSGAAVICGLAFPIPFRVDRGSSGAIAAGALLAFHLPIALFVAASAFFGAQLVQGRERWSWTVALMILPAVEWSAAMLGLGSTWGFVHGPETALWTAVVAGLLAARRGRTVWEQA